MTVAFSESDITKVKVGQPATVTLDALSGVELGAHVTAISTVGTTSTSVVSYDATLTLDQQRLARVKPGMSASASVIVDQAQGVTVPNDAVTGTGSLATRQRVARRQDRLTAGRRRAQGRQPDADRQRPSGRRPARRDDQTLPSLGSSSSAARAAARTGRWAVAPPGGSAAAADSRRRRRVPRVAAPSRGVGSGASRRAAATPGRGVRAPSERCADKHAPGPARHP